MKSDDFDVPRLTGVEALILLLLRDAGTHEMYGLELQRASGGKITRGSLYTTLDRIEQKGFIKSRREGVAISENVPEEHRIPRRLFKIAALGQAALAAHEAAREAFLTIHGLQGGL
jgi:PadR family transcriptional regulator, regulatory protein PadR